MTIVILKHFKLSDWLTARLTHLSYKLSDRGRQSVAKMLHPVASYHVGMTILILKHFKLSDWLKFCHVISIDQSESSKVLKF
jgi:hypothetical protein